jgi:hypothetical protein
MGYKYIILLVILLGLSDFNILGRIFLSRDYCTCSFPAYHTKFQENWFSSYAVIHTCIPVAPCDVCAVTGGDSWVLLIQSEADRLLVVCMQGVDLLETPIFHL